MRELITNTLRGTLEPLPFVYALWLEGADAGGTADEYSDMDFWVDFEDEYEAQAIAAVENALSGIAEMDYRHIMRHGHPKIRQRVYHLAGTSEYLLIDFCWQLHSRPKDEYTYTEGDTVEAVKVIFDKDSIIRYKPLDLAVFSDENKRRLEESVYRRSQQIRVEKYVRRGQYLEAYAYYNKYALEPLIDLLRLIYTPAHADYYLIHISQHIPAAEREKLEDFARLCSPDDLAEKLALAGKWFDELVEKVSI